MKKSLFSMLFVFGLALSLSVCITSCGDDDPVPAGGSSDDPGVNPDLQPANEAWETNRQKMYMEQVGKEVNQKISVEDFRHYIQLARYVDDTYIDGDYDWDDVGDWGEDIFNGLKQSLGKTEKEEDYSGEYEDGYYDGNGDWISVTYNYAYYNVYDYYKATILASNFLGHWTASNGKWTYSKADDLQFIFTNKQGQWCVLRLTTSGKVAKVHMTDVDDYVDYEYVEDGNNYIGTEYYDRTQFTIGVPEKIVVTLTEGNTTLFTQTINTNFSSITDAEFDLSKSSLTFSSSTTFNNGYSVDVKNVKYTSNSFTLETTMKKQNETLLKLALSSDLKNVPKQTLVSWYYMDDDEIEDMLMTTTATAAFSLDVLGEVQLKGKITDVHKLIDDMNDAYDNDKDEARFKRAIANVNARYEANIYYNGGTYKQAWMSLEPFEEKEYWSSIGGSSVEYDSYWDCEPVLKFADGTSYSFENYFTRKNFKDLVDALEEQEDKAEDIWDN